MESTRNCQPCPASRGPLPGSSLLSRILPLSCAASTPEAGSSQRLVFSTSSLRKMLLIFLIFKEVQACPPLLHACGGILLLFRPFGTHQWISFLSRCTELRLVTCGLQKHVPPSLAIFTSDPSPGAQTGLTFSVGSIGVSFRIGYSVQNIFLHVRQT